QANSTRAQEDLESEFQSLYALLDELKDQMLMKIKQERASRTYELQAQLAACAKALESSEELLEAANQALGTVNNHDFAQAAKQIKDSVTMAPAFRLSLKAKVSDNMSHLMVDFAQERRLLQALAFLPGTARGQRAAGARRGRGTAGGSCWCEGRGHGELCQPGKGRHKDGGPGVCLVPGDGVRSWGGGARPGAPCGAHPRGVRRCRGRRDEGLGCCAKGCGGCCALACHMWGPRGAVPIVGAMPGGSVPIVGAMPGGSVPTGAMPRGSVPIMGATPGGSVPVAHPFSPVSVCPRVMQSPKRMPSGRGGRDRFTAESYTVLGDTLIDGDDHYWEVRYDRDSKAFGVGVAYRSLGKFDQLGKTSASWCLHLNNWLQVSFSAKHANKAKVLDVPVPDCIGVYCNFHEGFLSFYNARTKQLLHTFKAKFTQPVLPAFTV
ncbi:FSD1 protein, partial [Todus mexicanus]|nr:FSD1 protein [Todus mexicanus]